MRKGKAESNASVSAPFDEAVLRDDQTSVLTQTQVCLSVGRPPDAETEHPPDWWYLTELYIVNTFR